MVGVVEAIVSESSKDQQYSKVVIPHSHKGILTPWAASHKTFKIVLLEAAQLIDVCAFGTTYTPPCTNVHCAILSCYWNRTRSPTLELM